MIGTTISDTTMPAMKIELTSGAPGSVLKIGIQPRLFVSHRESGTICGTRKRKPQMPKINAGTAASRSTSHVR